MLCYISKLNFYCFDLSVKHCECIKYDILSMVGQIWWYLMPISEWGKRPVTCCWGLSPILNWPQIPAYLANLLRICCIHEWISIIENCHSLMVSTMFCFKADCLDLLVWVWGLKTRIMITLIKIKTLWLSIGYFLLW